MVINPLSENNLQQLHNLLAQMNVYAQELEQIGQSEYEAIRSLDADQIVVLTDRRVVAHQALGELEVTCRNLLREQGIDENLTLEVIIDTHAGNKSAEFQSLRRNLYERMVKVDKASQENHLRILAAYNVSSSILQKLGLSQPAQTYSRR